MLRRALRSVRRWAGPTKAAAETDRTSITDQQDYLEFCSVAASDAAEFEAFRRSPVYVDALEHVTYQQGMAYAEVIRRDNPQLLGSWLETARANDLYGSPVTFDYPGLGRVSPVTLRYLKVLSDLEKHFGDLTDKDIIEIGVGYGGQCRLIVSRWPVRSYTLVDLEPALALASSYLSRFGLDSPKGVVRMRSDEDADLQASDLCISNYAFSELARRVQERYADAIVGHARAGYLTCNFVSDEWGIKSMDPEELRALHRGARWLREEPLTHPRNAILVWGDERAAERYR